MAAEKKIVSCQGCGKKYDITSYPSGTSFKCAGCGAQVKTPPAQSKAAAADEEDMTLAASADPGKKQETPPGSARPPADPEEPTMFPGTIADKAAAALQSGPGLKTSGATASKFKALEGFKKSKTVQVDGEKGRRFGEFRILRELGRGAMGVVYEAVQEGLNRRVALKVMLANFTSSSEAVERFLREGQAMAKLKHPNIVPVFGLGEAQGDYYYAMDYVEGKSLKDAIKDDVMPFKDRAAILRDAARGLDYAHKEGIIHRDIKPANIMLEKTGRVLIADFGIAKTEESSMLTAEGQILGTPMYMSPEQADGCPDIDNRADIYSLGATLYESITLSRPFHGEDVRSIIRNVIEVDPQPPRKIDPKIPRDLETICLKAMEKKPERRYATAGEFADDIDRFMNGEHISAKPPGIAGKIAKKIRKNKLATALLVLLFVVIAGGSGFGAFKYDERRKEIASRLSDARSAFESGDFALAKEKYLAVSAIDETNGEAREGVEKCSLQIAHMEEKNKEEERKRQEEEIRKKSLLEARKLSDEGAGLLAGAERDFEAARAAETEGRRADAAGLLKSAFESGEKAADAFSLALGKVRDYADAERGKAESSILKCRAEIFRGDFGRAHGYAIIAKDLAKGRFFAGEIEELERMIAGTGSLFVGAPPESGGEPRMQPGAAVEMAAVDPLSGAESAERKPLGPSPLLSAAAAMGSYVLYVSKEGFETARCPLLVERNAEVRIDFPLLPAGSVPEGMVYVPAGDFRTGDVHSGLRSAYLDGFLVDLREVTHEEYKKFVDTIADPQEKVKYVPRRRDADRYIAFWLSDKSFEARYGGKNLPVFGISWENADAFARWAGKRLPTVQEWEKAARGVDGRLWPWGDRFDRPDLCNHYDRRKEIGIEPVGSYPGSKSPFGCLDMAGNVAEFTSTEGETIEVAGRFIRQFAICGGSVADNKFNVMAVSRSFVKPEACDMGMGFRCVKDVK